MVRFFRFLKIFSPRATRTLSFSRRNQFSWRTTKKTATNWDSVSQAIINRLLLLCLSVRPTDSFHCCHKELFQSQEPTDSAHRTTRKPRASKACGPPWDQIRPDQTLLVPCDGRATSM